MEVYRLRNQREMDEQCLANHRLVFHQLSMKKDSSVLANILSDMLFAYKQIESEKLADKVSKKASRLMKAKNRGTKEAGYYVLRNTLIPAILIEVGYLTNPQEERLLSTSSYRQRIADGIALSILDYATN